MDTAAHVLVCTMQCTASEKKLIVHAMQVFGMQVLNEALQQGASLPKDVVDVIIQKIKQ